MNKRIETRLLAILTLFLFIIPVTAAQAEDVDFSCMTYKVWGKGFVSDVYKEYDVVLENRCPGAVYWSMCIERMDPWTNKIIETHTPGGYVEAEKKARVNLQLMGGGGEPRFHDRLQEFYVNIGYGIEAPASIDCHASECEAKKHELRAEVRANDVAWERVEKSLADRIDGECIVSGWETTSGEECRTKLREASQADLDQFVLKDQELREKMAAIDPERCQVWAGDLVGN